MLHKSIKFLIENKFIAVLLFLIFIFWGTINSPFNWQTTILPNNAVAVDAIPDIGENQQIIFTAWEGYSPQDIQDQISYPLTTALLGISGVKTIRSSSMFGFSTIYLIFDEDIDFYWSRSRILEKLNSLPSGLLPENVQPTLGPDATGLGQLFWYTLEGRDLNGNVTGGWSLQELRTLQDTFVQPALSATTGVSEVASVGGYVQEYQIDVNPELMRQYHIDLHQVVKAVQETNSDIGAQTIEMNQVEYIVRGLGSVQSISDLEHTVVTSQDFTSVKIKDIARVFLGPKARRGILDKEGAEVVGGVVTSRYGANPMKVIQQVKHKIKKLSEGLPTKTLQDGRISKVTIVPFYDRTELINETLATLEEALSLEILITILVIVLMVFSLRASLLIAGMLPIAVMLVFIAMKIFKVDANIVSLSGIAIAIGTMIDIAIILTENIIRHLNENENQQNITKVLKPDVAIYNATTEVSGAIITAVLTTIISFIPVFTLIGAEGKLFKPLAFTKTIALIASLFVALFLIPPFASFLFKKRVFSKLCSYTIHVLLMLVGAFSLVNECWLGSILILFGANFLLFNQTKNTFYNLPLFNFKFTRNNVNLILTACSIILMLAIYWQPLGIHKNLFWNLLFVGGICLGILGVFAIFKSYYARILAWTLENKRSFLCFPFAFVVIGFLIFKNSDKEFMPSLNEGSFLLMPTSMSHAGISENKRVLQLLDMAVATIPEVETVVGKAGRTNSILDPAPLSMYENIIQYKPEYLLNLNGKPQRYKVNEKNEFILKNGNLESYNSLLTWSSHHLKRQLIEDKNGTYFRNWRAHIQSPNDIWKEIVRVTTLPGVTTSPKLQPIETRFIMLQTGMRSPMGIKIKGQHLKTIEQFGLQLETILKQCDGIASETVFADRVVGKPYLLIDIDREKIARYGLAIQDVQNVLKVAIGGKTLSETIEGRERIGIRVRYPRELRDNPTEIGNIYIPLKNRNSIPLHELAIIRFEKGPQVIKSEDTFLVSYVLFDKQSSYADGRVIENAQQFIQSKISSGEITLPKGVQYEFTGTYENQIRAYQSLILIVPMVLLIIFFILYIQFRSISTTLIVFSGVAVAFAGGFIMLWLYGQEWFLNVTVFGENLRTLFQLHPVNLSVAVWIGFIALFGIATDDGVLMATQLSQVFKRNQPSNIKEIRSSVIEAGTKRIRPCLMTTATTILALLPVLTSTGKGSDMMIPMAIPSFGGMIIAVMSLFVVPVLFSMNAEYKLKSKVK